MDENIQNKLIHNAIIPVGILIASAFVLFKLVGYIRTLHVSGNANEWVLIMRNGTMQKAGVGLSTFRGPFDQVAKFPSQVNKVVFSTEQVTKEMQGVQVEGMLVWSINRQGDGPFNAYKNLGEDLASGNPTTANSNLTSMASAIVRSAIANSTIDQMLRNRQALRAQIRKEMFEVVKGWGVWLETIEITDVKISSSSLFKDLQANYRENMKKDAEVYRMKIESEIKVEQAKKATELDRLIQENTAIYNNYRDEINLQIKEQINLDDEKIMKLQQEQDKVKNEFDIFVKKAENSTQIAFEEINQVSKVAEIDQQVFQAQEKQKLIDAQYVTQKLREQGVLDREKTKKDSELLIEKQLMELKRKNVTPEVMKFQAMQAAKTAFSGKYFSTIEYVAPQPTNAVSELISTFLGQKKMIDH